MTQLVTTACNQCDQNNHSGCAAENLQRRGFIDDAGDHCKCAYDEHTKTPQTTREAPKIKSMLGRQDKERDIPSDTREVAIEDEMEIERD